MLIVHYLPIGLRSELDISAFFYAEIMAHSTASSDRKHCGIPRLRTQGAAPHSTATQTQGVALGSRAF